MPATNSRRVCPVRGMRQITAHIVNFNGLRAEFDDSFHKTVRDAQGLRDLPVGCENLDSV
jgi:hypothetical protein